MGWLPGRQVSGDLDTDLNLTCLYELMYVCSSIQVNVCSMYYMYSMYVRM